MHKSTQTFILSFYTFFSFFQKTKVFSFFSFFPIVKVNPSQKSRFYLQLLKMQSGFILTHFFYCPSAVVKGNNLPIDIVTSTFFRNNFIQIVTVLILSMSVCKTVQRVNVLLFKKLAYIRMD